MPEKNTDNDLEKELAYCKELDKRIENEPSISSIPAVKENLTLSKDTDAKTGHKSAESSFFGYKTHLAMTEERIITAPLHQDQKAFQETEYYKEKAKHRYKIEAKNSELKNVNGYDKAISYGISNM